MRAMRVVVNIEGMTESSYIPGRAASRFIYPFLDAHKPYAWAVYLSLYASFWAAFLLFLGLHWAKGRLLESGLARKVKLQHKVQ